MSHFGRSGPPDIRDTFSLLILNISYRTTADDLFPLFDKYGKVVDIFIPRDRRTGDSRGFAFVRYKYADEAQKAVDRLDGRTVDGRNIVLHFAKYGPNAERMYRDDHRGWDYRSRSRSRSCGRYEHDRYHKSERDFHHTRVRSITPDYKRGHGRGKHDNNRSRSRSHSFDRGATLHSEVQMKEALNMVMLLNLHLLSVHHEITMQCGGMRLLLAHSEVTTIAWPALKR